MANTHVIMVRLRCKVKTCRRIFEIPDTVWADTGTEEEFKAATRCPECQSEHVGETDVQPCPRMWWSDTYGLVTEISRDGDRRLMWTEPGIGKRQAKVLPPDAVELRQVPKPLERYDVERLALDEYSMLWEKSKGTMGDHMAAMKHVVGVLLYGDAAAPEEG